VQVLQSTATRSFIQIRVPSVNLDTVVSFDNNFANFTETGNARTLEHVITFGLSYVSLGVWAHADEGPFRLPQNLTAYAFGFETPAAGMPTTGTALYSGTGTVRGLVLIPDGVHIGGTQLTGNASLTANFGNGSIAGAFTGMSANDGSSVTSWNDVSLNASIVAGTNFFNGTTQATTQPSTPYALKGTATGFVNGGFYGPNAENLGAIWSLRDGTGAAIGGVAAGR
jgi:hypothetical protein